ncbi:hypothetical protein KOW79_019041 [Hemibagrus wyckioides]|uniref:Uncharacterized protein n=1 Tax=Hemibagrus wyckioides TaxID=337641 RepID=A0A9D3SB30_9TELE|nr:hypothetical protein KOW79_019041 [Hemibagrus wyckioides]
MSLTKPFYSKASKSSPSAGFGLTRRRNTEFGSGLSNKFAGRENWDGSVRRRFLLRGRAEGVVAVVVLIAGCRRVALLVISAAPMSPCSAVAS